MQIAKIPMREFNGDHLAMQRGSLLKCNIKIKPPFTTIATLAKLTNLIILRDVLKGAYTAISGVTAWD